MSTIYNQTYKVPVWVVVTDDKTANGGAAVAYLTDNGAFKREWPSLSFIDTVKNLGKRGWAHLVNQPYPYMLDASFLPVAISTHLKEVFGQTKMVSGAPARPWNHAVNRKVESDLDWQRIFDQIMSLEDSMSLSHLFDVGNKCFGQSTKYKVFFSNGEVPISVLQRISDNVIVVGEMGNVNTTGKTAEETVNELDAMLTQVLGL